MLDKNSVLSEAIQATSLKLNLSQFAVEKDYHVTRAIEVLTRVENEFFALVFQGGTSLSKAYQLIHRLSEDADFRVVQKEAAWILGKEARRERLRDFRHELICSLKKVGFNIAQEWVDVDYEGRFMSIKASFANADKLTYLKPYIAVDCFLGDVILPPVPKLVTTLIKQALGEKCDHKPFSVHCAALDETAAEKWVALTRRIAYAQTKIRAEDKHLVRHIYDLYHLQKSCALTGAYAAIAHQIVDKDRRQFAKQHTDYAHDPIKVSQLGLDLIFTEDRWREHWDNFLMHMVYEQNKPSFDKAYGYLQMMSQEIFRVVP